VEAGLEFHAGSDAAALRLEAAAAGSAGLDSGQDKVRIIKSLTNPINGEGDYFAFSFSFFLRFLILGVFGDLFLSFLRQFFGRFFDAGTGIPQRLHQRFAIRLARIEDGHDLSFAVDGGLFETVDLRNGIVSTQAARGAIQNLDRNFERHQFVVRRARRGLHAEALRSDHMLQAVVSEFLRVVTERRFRPRIVDAVQFYIRVLLHRFA